MLRLRKLANEAVIGDPYAHVVSRDTLERVDDLNEDFPAKDGFGPTIRMDGDLTAGDPGYETLLARSAVYRDLHRQVYSAEFIETFLTLFRRDIRRALRKKELLLDPFDLQIVPEPIEKRVSGRSFVGGVEPFLFPRFDIGYGGVGYGVKNGGRGVHVDNLPRLVSVLVFLNMPRSMVGGSHRLYGLRGGDPVLRRTYPPAPGLVIASLQSNRAFHDVDPITSIEGERRAFYIAVSCSVPIWKREVHPKLCKLNKNRYDAPPASPPATGWRRLLSLTR